jgi:hypothetical protein
VPDENLKRAIKATKLSLLSRLYKNIKILILNIGKGGGYG